MRYVRIVRFAAVMLLAFMVLGKTANAAEGAKDFKDSEKLTIDDVLQSSATHFPAILKSIANRDAAEGRVLSAQGAFDVLFSADGFDRASGVWTGQVVNTEVRRNFRPLGLQVFGGYRISDGEFPIYEDINFTNSLGEAKIGALFSLLRDRAFDQRRFRENDARLALQQADLEVLLTKIGVQRRAIVAYWRWVAAGLQLRVYQKLLSIAEDRESGLEEQVRRGARAAIFITENRQNITRRQRLVLETERDFQTAANNLSFFYRGENSKPIIPQPSALPAQEMAQIEMVNADISDFAVSDALVNRPELGLLRKALERANAQERLSKNELKPRLDLNAEVSNDFGDIAEGGPTRDSTDVVVGFKFSVPLQRREAKGRLRSAEAASEALRQDRRQAEERIELEIRNILIDYDIAQELARIATLEVQQTATMENAERERFASGASDFFLVNVREETAADARIRSILAQLQTQIAAANYNSATVDLEKLGLSTNGF
ncbi:MAG: TolC family protein [Pseudomonadota bacterium]